MLNVLLLSDSSAAGVNLQDATVTVHFDQPAEAVHAQQREWRAMRCKSEPSVLHIDSWCLDPGVKTLVGTEADVVATTETLLQYAEILKGRRKLSRALFQADNATTDALRRGRAIHDGGGRLAALPRVVESVMRSDLVLEPVCLFALKNKGVPALFAWSVALSSILPVDDATALAWMERACALPAAAPPAGDGAAPWPAMPEEWAAAPRAVLTAVLEVCFYDAVRAWARNHGVTPDDLIADAPTDPRASPVVRHSLKVLLLPAGWFLPTVDSG